MHAWLEADNNMLKEKNASLTLAGRVIAVTNIVSQTCINPMQPLETIMENSILATRGGGGG